MKTRQRWGDLFAPAIVLVCFLFLLGAFGVGGVCWVILAISLHSQLMLGLFLVPVFMPFLALTGLYSLFFDTPDWVVSLVN